MYMHRLRGPRRPPANGSDVATVESVRLDPELRDALNERARRDDETTSAVIRKALRKYLDVT
jgi:predicted transcriptional regulator